MFRGGGNIWSIEFCRQPKIEEVPDATLCLEVVKPSVVTPTKKRKSDAERLLVSACKEHPPTCNMGKKTMRQAFRDAGESVGMSAKKVARLTGTHPYKGKQTPSANPVSRGPKRKWAAAEIETSLKEATYNQGYDPVTHLPRIRRKLSWRDMAEKAGIPESSLRRVLAPRRWHRSLVRSGYCRSCSWWSRVGKPRVKAFLKNFDERMRAADPVVALFHFS